MLREEAGVTHISELRRRVEEDFLIGQHKSVSPEISRTIAGVSSKPQLSERHRAILDYVARGLSNPEIGKLLGIGPDCVKAHLKIIYSRLGVATRAEAVAFALRENLLKP